MSQQFNEIELERLRPDPSQPRTVFEPDYLNRLSVSIKKRGILVPLRVRPAEAGFWWIVLGESRWRAAKLALLDKVPCIIADGDASEIDRLTDQISENELKASLTNSEFARALAKLKLLTHRDSRTLAAELGLSPARMTRAEALLTLPADVQELVDTGRLGDSLAYEISRLESEAAQRELAFAAEGGKLTRERVIETVRATVPKRNVPPRSSRVTAKVDGLSITLSGGEPLSWDSLLAALSRLQRKAKALYDDGKPVADLPRAFRAS